jgi:general secretion pathway protein I
MSLRRHTQLGFTLLEVMVALAILAITATVLLEIVTNNVRATNHAKMMTQATFLARTKMVDVEDSVLTNGFTENDENDSGNFKDQGHQEIRWETAIERIELPTDLTQKSQDQARDQSDNAKDPMSLMTGFLGGMMSSFIEPIRIGLQESVRKVTVRVFWDENGRPDQSFEVVQYLTDPSKLESSGLIQAGPNGVPGLPGTGTTPGAAPGAAGSLPGLGGLPGLNSLPGMTR